jgi:hypothetical protein
MKGHGRTYWFLRMSNFEETGVHMSALEMPPSVQPGGEFDRSVLILRGCGRRGEAVALPNLKVGNFYHRT